MTMTVTHCAKRSSGHAAAPRAGRVSTWECVWAPRCQPMIMAGSDGGALRCRPGGLEEGLKTCFECDDRLMDTTQTGRERSRNMSRSLQGHDPPGGHAGIDRRHRFPWAYHLLRGG